MEQLRQHTVDGFDRYWPGQAPLVNHWLQSTGIRHRQPPVLPPLLAWVRLPDWAADIGVSGRLCIPGHCIQTGQGRAWRRTSWIDALTWYAHGIAERLHEKQHGPIHSYAHRLRGWDARQWQHAWGNRIALFMRRWCARDLQRDERQLFGPLPRAEIILTHDVDAVEKKLLLRIKQFAYRLLAILNNPGQITWARVNQHLRAAFRFLLSPGAYFQLDTILDLEKRAERKSIFFFYAGQSKERSLLASLIDPQYNLQSSTIRQGLGQLRSQKWPIGLHPSFDSWRDAHRIKGEKDRLQHAVDQPIRACRQHWLRFSWQQTWKAQAAAGLDQDYTLGFNDRFGFRSGCAIAIQPWDFEHWQPLNIQTIPLVLMDAQLYPLQAANQGPSHGVIRALIDEIRAVGGQASVLWHPHGFSPDFGWQHDYETLLDCADDNRHANQPC